MRPFQIMQRRQAGGGGGGSFAGMASLFAAAEKGAYYDFTDATKLAVNGDGTGGSPSSGGTVKWAVDQSPNLNHLRNNQTAGLPTYSATGVTTSGTNYGLFNMSGFGNWPSISQPFEIIACMSQIAYAGADQRIIAFGASSWFLQGASSGAVRFFDGGYGSSFTPGLNTEFTIDGYFNGASTLDGINGGAMAAGATGAGQPATALVLGSTTAGGASGAQIRFKRLVIVGRALTPTERAGVYAWASA